MSAFQKNQHAEFHLLRRRNSRWSLVRRKTNKPALSAKAIAGSRSSSLAENKARQISEFSFGHRAVLHRAAHAFDWAVQYLRTRRVDVRPLLSAQLPLSRAAEAFALAADRSRSTKVQLVCD